QVGRLFTFENPPGVAASEAKGIGNTRAVTEQSANIGKLSQIIDCRERMARCEPDQLIAPTQKERIGAYDDGINMLLNETREGCVDIAFAAGIRGNELDAVCARRSLNVCGLGLRRGISGVDEEADNGGARHQLAQQFQPLRPERVDKEGHSRNVAAGAVETGHETDIDRIGAYREDNRNVWGCRFGGQRSRRAKCKDRGHGVSYQVGRHCRQSVEFTTSHAIFDCHIAAFDIAGFLEALPERAELSIWIVFLLWSLFICCILTAFAIEYDLLPHTSELTNIDARLAIRIKDAGAVAYQSADHGKLAPLIDRWDRMVRGEHDE